MLYCLFSSLPLHLFRYHICEYGVSTHSDTGTCTHAHKPFITCPRLWIISALQGQGDAAGKLKSERSAGFDLSVLPNPRDEDRNRPMLSLFKCWWLETFPYLIFNGTYFSSATSKPISSDPCFFPPPSKKQFLTSAHISHRIQLSLFLKHFCLIDMVSVSSVCESSAHTITLSDFLFVICLVVIVQRRILPSLPHDEELSRWSYHWFILPALSVWLMALYSQANPSSNCTVTDSLGFINEANIFRTIEAPSQNTLIESSVSFDFLFFLI